MPRKKSQTAEMDPMSVAILAALKPHIDAAVRDQIATVLLEAVGKIAPERLAKARAIGADPAPALVAEVTAKPDSGPAKAAHAGKRNGAE